MDNPTPTVRMIRGEPEKKSDALNAQDQASMHLVIEHVEYRTTHELAQSLIKLAVMLRRLPDTHFTEVQFYSSAECQI